MAVEHVLAVLPVSDIAAAEDWYAKLFGRGPDNNPMPSLVEWQLTDGGFLQVTLDPERAGRGLFNLAVSDLDADRREVLDRGLSPAEPVGANKGVRLSALTDPDGNTITLIGGFRPRY